MSTRGRKTISDTNRPMTSIERTKRVREKRRLLKKEMAHEGYQAVQVFLPQEIIEALNIIEKGTDGEGVSINDTTELSYLICLMVAHHAEEIAKQNNATRSMIELVNSPNWHGNFYHKNAQHRAELALKEWTEEKIK